MSALSNTLVNARTRQLGRVDPDVGKTDLKAGRFCAPHEGDCAAAGQRGFDAEALVLCDHRVASFDCQAACADDIYRSAGGLEFGGDLVGIHIGDVAPEHVIEEGSLARTIGACKNPQDRWRHAVLVSMRRSILTVSMRPSGCRRIT